MPTLDALPRWTRAQQKLGKGRPSATGTLCVLRAATKNEGDRRPPAELMICAGNLLRFVVAALRQGTGSSSGPRQLPEVGGLPGERLRVRDTVTPADGQHPDPPPVREAYADRVEELFSRHIKDFMSLVLTAASAELAGHFSRSTTISWWCRHRRRCPHQFF